MARKKNSKSPSKSTSRKGEKLDASLEIEELYEGLKSTSSTSKLKKSAKVDIDVNEVEYGEVAKSKPPTSTKSIIKCDRKYGGDLNDTDDDTKKATGKSSKTKIAPSDETEKDGTQKQKSWFWQRKKSGAKDDDEVIDKEELERQAIIANRPTKTIEDCETEYHEAIREHDWNYLEGLLKEYDFTLFNKPKKPAKGQPKKNIKLLKYMPDMPKLKKDKEGPEIPISPLMALDKDGRTPLHLCCIEPTPSKLLLRVMNCERNAATIKDKKGSLPLHYAIENRRKVNVIERLVRGYYQGSWIVDGQNRSPLMLAIQVVVEKQEEDSINPTKTYWGFPASPEDIKWQEDQKRIWKLAQFLLQNRIDRRKRLLTVEHNQVLVALNKCAPPEIISNILATGKRYLMKEEVAEKVLFLLISRQYPITLFKWFQNAVTDPFIKQRKDFTGCGVVAAHFRVGCIKHIDQNTSRERDSFAITMKRLGFAKKNEKQFVVPPQYTEWWEKLKLFINLWATHFWDDDNEENDGDEDENLLHNALMNSDSPPLLIQLLAKLYPKSISLTHPKSSALPIHFACRQWQFQEYPPRRGEKIISLDQICGEFLKEDATQTRKRHRKRLPLHHAIKTGKTWDFIKPLVTNDLKSLLVRDPLTNLRPFQLAALKSPETYDIEEIARREFLPMVWNTMHDDDRDRQMRKVLFHFDLKQVNLIYELLRHSPGAVTKVLSPSELLLSMTNQEDIELQRNLAREHLLIITKMKIARSIFGLGNVQGHFIGWCYEGDTTGAWKPHRRNFPMVKNAIIDGFIPKGMHKWWGKLQFWLWQDCPWENIPRRADFLLHCALCNPKVSPWIVELILELFPRAATLQLPNSGGCFPLHIACATDTYIPLAFEYPNKRSVIEMMAKAFHNSILMKWNNTLPLHYAILGSKQWSEIRLMAEDEPVSLAIPDPEHDFFPFQLMAHVKLYTKFEMQRFVNIAMTTDGKHHWEKLSPNEKMERLKKVLLKHERDSLGCIFELVKRNPMLLHVGTEESKNRKQFRGNGIASGNRKPTNKISVQEYLKMLEPKQSPSDAEPTPNVDKEIDEPTPNVDEENFDGESALLESWVF
jgi:hypothetical protein